MYRPEILGKEKQEPRADGQTCPIVLRTSHLCLPPQVTELWNLHDYMPFENMAYNQKKLENVQANCATNHKGGQIPELVCTN